MPDYQDLQFFELEDEQEIKELLNKFIVPNGEIINIVSEAINQDPFKFLYNNKN
tara:strand:+ start:594 stop:755 length:162 start_codon:yes stop_codon:yes gene_type:complete